MKLLRSKQKSFLNKIRKQKRHTIRSIGYNVDEYKVTLIQVLMGMMSATDEDKSLFISIQDKGGTGANFVFH
jgi:hypothetical protein